MTALFVLLPMASAAFTGYLWGYDRGEGKGFWRGLDAGRREHEWRDNTSWTEEGLA